MADFREEDHPRDDDGKFVDKTGGSASQSKKVRDRIFDRNTEYHQNRIDRLEERIASWQTMIDDPNYDEEENETKEIIQAKIDRSESNIKKYTELKEASMKASKEMKDRWDNLGLVEISGIGKNTHKVGSRGFKNGTTKSLIKDWKLELGRRNYLTKRKYESFDGGHEDKLIRVEEWDNKLKGRTIIDSNIPQDDDGTRGDLQNEIMFFWNEVMTDDQRSGIDVLKIYWSENPVYKTRSDDDKERTLGSHSGRKDMTYREEKPILLVPSVLTINLSYDDTLDDVLNTMVHEIAHNQWSNNIKNNWTKVNRFTDKILSLGKEGAVTEYAGSYFDDLEKVKKENENKWEEEKDRLINHNNYGKAEHQTQAEYETWLNQNILNDVVNAKKRVQDDIRKNIARVERLIANETHSEYFGMVSAPTDKAYHTVGTVKLQEISKLIKEGLYD